MAKSIKTVVISFRISSIDLIEVRLESPQPSEKIKMLGFALSITRHNNKDKNLINVIGKVIIDGDKKKTLGSIKVSIDFDVKDMNSYFEEGIHKFKFPKQFYTELNAITISTIRGIMFSQFKGTFLNGAILPLINPNNLEVVSEE